MAQPPNQSTKGDSAAIVEDGRGGTLGAIGLVNNEKLELFKKCEVKTGEVRVGRFRHVVALLALSSILLANMNRQAYNQAIPRMSKSKSASDQQKAEIELELASSAPKNPPDQFEAESTLNSSMTAPEVETTATRAGEEDVDDDRYDWSVSQISTLQAAFNYGYAPFMIPGGRLSEVYGAKWVVFLTGAGSALCMILTPLFADHNFILLVAARVLMGLCQTGVSPALYALLTRWLPPEESSVYLAMIKVGVMVGFMLGALLNSWLPWRLVFYLMGIISLIWSLMWTICVSSSPAEHKFLSKTELAFIERRLLEHANEANAGRQPVEEVDDTSKQEDNHLEQEKPPLSERAKLLLEEYYLFMTNIMLNVVVLAFTVTKFTVKLSTEAQSTFIPMYLAKAFEVSDKFNGNLSAFNFFLQAVLTGVVAYLAKEMVVRKSFGLSKTHIRKLFQGINNFGMGLAFLMISFNGGSLALVCSGFVILSIVSMFGSGGEAVLPVDLTTEYSATIMSVANCVANFSGIILPKVAELLLNDDLTSHLYWKHVWWFVSGVLMLGGLSFVCLVEARLQDFNKSSKKNTRIANGCAIDVSKLDTSNTTVALIKFKKINLADD